MKTGDCTVSRQLLVAPFCNSCGYFWTFGRLVNYDDVKKENGLKNRFMCYEPYCMKTIRVHLTCAACGYVRVRAGTVRAYCVLYVLQVPQVGT